ncbi:ADP-ribosyltransferase domain-containing protein [Enterobacter mori]|uniref:ADP-ribosyltransferase domain-containing protein n=1 Tax=Enterobacter mori TaxID=539813 RepID=UPI001B8B420B|nr:ADP-ribosyltransferase domain-containing protein [Enterobacter mori]MBS3049719.1 hypothetical protein [Enterobacter mori]
MTISAVNDGGVMSVNTARQIRRELQKESTQLSREIANVQNSLEKLKLPINNLANCGNVIRAVVEQIRSVSIDYGEDATIRLKNGHFKHGQASGIFKNLLYSSRYQAEREAAVKTLGADGSEISSGAADKILSDKHARMHAQHTTQVVLYGSLEKKLETLQSNVESVKIKITQLNEITAEADKIDKQKEREREDFSLIYQSNAGCKAINHEARYYYRNVGSGGNVSKSDVIGEYKKAHGDDIFNRGNKKVISDIKSLCSDLAGLVKKSAESFYTPTERNKTTYRGQGMTPEGISKLITQFNYDESNKTETVYKVGQFFSTSLHKNIAEDFANRSKDAVKVIFEVKGNSGHGVTAQNGLQFGGHEDEQLYSPLAKFKVTEISNTVSNTYHVKLEEVTDVVSERLLPY